MKRNDYINIQAPMIADLHLKGNELLVFALIHGYTKDGKSKCRVSLNYMANWLCTGKSAVIKVINTLEEAGYINRHEYMEGMVRCVEYTTNYEYLLDQVSRGVEVSLESVKKSRGVKLAPATECAQIEGCQDNTGVKLTTKGCQVDNERGVKMTPNNKYIINYNNYFFYSDDASLEKEQKKIFSKIFFLRKANDPVSEADRFVAYNKSIGWKSRDGKVSYDTIEQRMALADLWEFSEGKAEGSRLKYIEAISLVVEQATSEGMSDAEVLINPKHGIRWDRKENRWYWSITADAHSWIFGCKERQDLIHCHLDPVFNGIPVSFKRIN